MKKYFTFVIFTLLYLLISESYCNNFAITPIILNFKGATVDKNVTVAYADLGSALISRDNEISWEQKRIFIGGEIINVFIDNENMTAFNNSGEIAISNNTGGNWSIAKKLEDSVLAVVKHTDGYFIRMRNKLMTISNQFEKLNEIQVESKVLAQKGIYYFPTYNKSILFSDNKFVAEFDSSVFIRFDKYLVPIDTLKLLEKVNFGNYLSGYRIFAESNNMYLKYSYSLSGSIYSSVFKTTDFKNIEKVADSLSAENFYSISNGKVYSLGVIPNKKLKDTTKLTDREINLLYKESIVANDKLYILGDYKILTTLNLKDSTIRGISDFSRASFRVPDQINDSSYLFYSIPEPSIYKTENNGLTIAPSIDISGVSHLYKFHFFNLSNNYYDIESDKLYCFGVGNWTNQALMLTSNDRGRTFDSTILEGVNFKEKGELQIYYKNAFRNYNNNIQKREDDFIMSVGYWSTPISLTIFSSIITINTKGELIKNIMDSNIVYNHVYSKDINTYLVHSCNIIDSTSQIIYSNNGGKSWDIIHKYPLNEIIGEVFNIEVKGRKYLALTHFDYSKYPTSNIAFLDVVDIETNEYFRLMKWDVDDILEYGLYGLAITSDSGKAYISFQDSLFVTDDLFNKTNWRYFLLPEDGRVITPLKKFGNKFYCRYKDNNTPYTNNTFWLQPLDSIISGLENTKNVEEVTYLYTMPPYPNPTRSEVTAKFYWDSRIDIDNSEIAVFDLNGNKVSGKENLILEKLNEWSGNIKWNCIGQPKGTYLIKIQHGNNTKTVKVVVN
jgi:hypothetical protein